MTLAQLCLHSMQVIICPTYTCCQAGELRLHTLKADLKGCPEDSVLHMLELTTLHHQSLKSPVLPDVVTWGAHNAAGQRGGRGSWKRMDHSKASFSGK